MGTSYWREAIDKEMRNVLPAFQFLDDDKVPIGHKHITCHMIFDIKMVGLIRKARFVAGGPPTDPPVESVYSSVVTWESVRIMFLIAALNDLQVIGADIQNAYINARTGEQMYGYAKLRNRTSLFTGNIYYVMLMIFLLSVMIHIVFLILLVNRSP